MTAPTLTTTETYKVNTVPLNTLAYNLSTFVGRVGGASFVGENVKRGFTHGADYVPKTLPERTETWAMWVRGLDVDGTRVTNKTMRQVAQANLDTLKALFQGNPRRLLSLERKVQSLSGLVTQTASGECVGFQVAESVAGGTMFTLAVDIRIPAGSWASAQVTRTITPGATTTFTVDGTTVAIPDTITLNGPLSAVTITDNRSGDVLAYAGTVADGDTLVLTPDTFTVDTPSAWDDLTWTGDWWMQLPPGTASFTVAATGAGDIDIAFRPRWI